MWAWLFRTQLPGGVPLWWAAAAGLYGSQGTTGESQRQIAGATATLLGAGDRAAAVRDAPARTLSSQEVAQMAIQRARMLPGAVVQGSALLPALVGRGYEPIGQVGDALLAPFRRADLPPVTGLEGLPTLAEMLADFAAGARVPVASAFPPPWRPNPLLGAVVGFLGKGLAQLWGLLNRPPALQPAPDWNLPNGTTGTFSSPVTVELETWGQTSQCVFLSGRWAPHPGANPPCNWNDGQVYTYVRSVTVSNVIGYVLKTSDEFNLGPQLGGGTPGIGTEVRFFRDGQPDYVHYPASTGPVGTPYPDEWVYVRSWAVGYPTSFKVAGQELPKPLVPIGPATAPPDAWPDVLPAVDPAAPPLVLPSVPAPTPLPARPDVLPVEQPEPVPLPVRPPGRATPPVRVAPGGPAIPASPGLPPQRPPVVWPGTTPSTPAQPTPTPSTPPGTDPATPQPGTTPGTDPAAPQQPNPFVPIPGAQPIPNDGSAPVPAPSPTPTTSPDTLVPWPGAKPIKVDQLAPPPTIEGIAKKTGEIEGKLDQIGGMLQPDLPDFDWGDALQGLAQLIGWLSSADPAGGYEISSPCETGPGSSGDPLVAEWGASLGPNASILKRLDAIAELLQHHKTLKQPSCKNPPPVGEWVTVNFEELHS